MTGSPSRLVQKSTEKDEAMKTMKTVNLHHLHRFHFIASSLHGRKTPSRQHPLFGAPDSESPKKKQNNKGSLEGATHRIGLMLNM